MDTFPTFTVAFIIVMDIVVGFRAWQLVAGALTRMTDIPPERRRQWQIGTALVMITWLVVVYLLSTRELLSVLVANGIGLFAAVIVPILVGVGVYRISPMARRIVSTIPQQQLLGIQVFRNLGFVFLIFLDMGLAPAAFALPAGLGDVLVGMLAPFVTYWYITERRGAVVLAFTLHALGLLDFVGAIGTAAFVADPTAFAPDIVPYATLIPGYVVPIFSMMHFASISNLIANPLKLQRGQPSVGTISETGD